MPRGERGAALWGHAGAGRGACGDRAGGSGEGLGLTSTQLPWGAPSEAPFIRPSVPPCVPCRDSPFTVRLTTLALWPHIILPGGGVRVGGCPLPRPHPATSRWTPVSFLLLGAPLSMASQAHPHHRLRWVGICPCPRPRPRVWGAHQGPTTTQQLTGGRGQASDLPQPGLRSRPHFLLMGLPWTSLSSP